MPSRTLGLWPWKEGRLADMTINGDRDGVRFSWPRFAVVVGGLLVFGAVGGRVLDNQDRQQKQLNDLTDAVAAQNNRLNDLTDALRDLGYRVPPRIDAKGRILK